MHLSCLGIAVGKHQPVIRTTDDAQDMMPHFHWPVQHLCVCILSTAHTCFAAGCICAVNLQVRALLLASSSKQAGPGGTGPREASTDDVMRAADALVKSKELLGALKKKLANAAAPVRRELGTGGRRHPDTACMLSHNARSSGQYVIKNASNCRTSAGSQNCSAFLAFRSPQSSCGASDRLLGW